MDGGISSIVADFVPGGRRDARCILDTTGAEAMGVEGRLQAVEDDRRGAREGSNDEITGRDFGVVRNLCRGGGRIGDLKRCVAVELEGAKAVEDDGGGSGE